MDWSLFISAAALLLSLWNTIERWIDKQPSLFVSDVNLEVFTNDRIKKAFIRIDLTLNVLSSRPIPVSGASVSMGKAPPCICSQHSPTPHTLDYCSVRALDRNRKLDDFFGPSIRFPATLPPSSAQHICLWLSLPADSELLCTLLEASCSPMESAAASSTGHRFRNPRASLQYEEHTDELRTLRDHSLVFLFRSGNCTLAASALIDMRNSSLLPD